MSWRILVVTLLLALGASAWGGIQLGDWLVQHAPQAAPPPGQDDDPSQQPVLDANGKPYLAQPPQPRVDGTLGVPEKTVAPDWNIQTVSLFDTVKDGNVLLSRSSVTPSQAAEIAAAARTSLPEGENNDSALDTMASPSYGQGQIMASNSFSGVTMVQSPQMPASRPAGDNGGWLPELRRELAQCANAGFFERPTCAWNARNRYCGPNQSWGKITECPQRP